jgi:hypothetical protein
MEYIGSYRIYYRLKLENKLYFHAWPYLRLITVSLTIHSLYLHLNGKEQDQEAPVTVMITLPQLQG